jgi:putative transposase
VSEVRELKQLRDKSRKLKQLVADLSLDKTALREALKRKWGCRRCGWPINVKHVYRLCREERLQLARKRPRRRKSVVARPAAVVLTGPNQRWATDFVHDVLATGDKLRVLTLIDL